MDSELAIQAIESSELLIISYDDLKELYLLSNNWLVLLHYLTQLAVIKSFTISKELSGKEAFEKYSYFIKSHPELINRIPLQHLASYLGITKETLSRVRKKQTL